MAQRERVRPGEPPPERQDVGRPVPQALAVLPEERAPQPLELGRLPERRGELQVQEERPELQVVAQRQCPPQPVAVRPPAPQVSQRASRPSSRLPLPLPQQLLRPLPRGNACAPIPHARYRENSSASSSP